VSFGQLPILLVSIFCNGWIISDLVFTSCVSFLFFLVPPELFLSLCVHTYYFMLRFRLCVSLFRDMLGRISWSFRPGLIDAFYFMRRPVRLVSIDAFCFLRRDLLYFFNGGLGTFPPSTQVLHF